MFNIQFDIARPIYLQLIDEVKRALARGVLVPGDKLASQRELAQELRVNANTIQRAYREMEQMGLVETLRGQGTFVKQDEGLVKEVRAEMTNQIVQSFIKQMKALGCDEERIFLLVGQEIEKGARLHD